MHYKYTGNLAVKVVFQQIQKELYLRKYPCFIGHIRAHSGLPGPLLACNALAVQYTRLTGFIQAELARQSHDIHHQNSRSLRNQFPLTKEAAR